MQQDVHLLVCPTARRSFMPMERSNRIVIDHEVERDPVERARVRPQVLRIPPVVAVGEGEQRAGQHLQRGHLAFHPGHGPRTVGIKALSAACHAASLPASAHGDSRSSFT